MSTKPDYDKMLTALPSEVKDLVNDGVYALYECVQPKTAFVLITDEPGVWLLSSKGIVVERRPSASGIALGKSVKFGHQINSSTTLKVNYA